MYLIKNLTQGTMFPKSHKINPGEQQVDEAKYAIISQERGFKAYKAAGLVKVFKVETKTTVTHPKTGEDEGSEDE